MEKIIADDMRTMSLKEEKNNLLIARSEMKKEAERQKQQMLETFEKMKLKGKINQKELSKISGGKEFGTGAATSF